MAKYAGKNGVGILLTGMGTDGAKGLCAMKKSGGYTIIQEEESCIIYGMPKAAFELGACLSHTPLNSMADKIMEYSN